MQLAMAKTCSLVSVYAVLLVIIYFQIPCLTQTPTSLTTDHSSLLSLKTRVTVDPYHILTRNWTNSSSICNWIGVTCGLRHHRVTALNISHMGLSGTIPPQLGNLSFLISLDMGYNFFNGTLPREISLLHRLKFISLRDNNFDGEIPQSFGHLPNLEYFSLTNNSFTGAIPSAIFNISTLQNMYLSYNDLSGGLPTDICRNLPFLEVIGLSENQLSGEIPSNLSQCQQLQVVSLSYNSFEGEIPASFGKLTSLQILYLGGNFLYGVIPKEMGNLQHLVELSIKDNQITGALPINIISNMSSLQYLNLRSNKMSGSLSKDIGNITLLNYLSLGENNFTGVIPREIGRLYHLESLFLRYNKLSGKLSKDMGNLTMLKQLELIENNLTGSIPTEIGHLHQLEQLAFSANSFTGSIPPEIFNISTLQYLLLGYNDLSGTLPPHLCTALPNLQWLTLSSNHISGVIPDSISYCAHLTALGLGSNIFNGFVPHSLGNLSLLENLQLSSNHFITESSSSELSFITSLTKCTSLRTLEIDNNPLAGIIPPSIGIFSFSLQRFTAHNCKIKGTIPDEIHNLSNLTELDLSNNELSGVIPSNFRHLLNLQKLDLHRNNLGGPIPEGLCNLHSLFDIRLSQNQLSGPIPQCLGNVSSLRHLFLNSNKLNLSIPSSLWSLKDLLSLDLSSNSLSGILPLEIGNLMPAIYINLSMNNLSESIPNTIGKLQSVVNLSLAHNRLKGSIPVSVGSMLSLVSLDLSCNNLFGSIPKSLEKLHQLEYFNVSFNYLSGQIPSGGNFRNFTMESFEGNDAICETSRFHGSQICHTVSSNKSRKYVEFSLVALAGVVLLITVITLIFIFVHKRKGKMINGIIELASVVPHKISYYEIVRATEHFNDSNLLGTGSYGSVYRGILRDGMMIAVKVFFQQPEAAFDSFGVECEVLRNIRHRNLTKVLSICSNEDFKALVLEYMPNGNLEKWLYSHNNFLNVRQRLDIMIDVASALEYLHYGYGVSIVHCDLKPSNVLLDEQMIAHVSDFGISKLLGDEDSTVITNTLATLGYIAPEYGLEGLVSTRCDVYSYGVMLIETFTRKRPSDDMFGGNMTLKSWIASLLPHSSHQVVDPNLFMNLDDEHGDKILQCVSSILVLALKCSTESPGERINIKEALTELQKIKHQFISNN